MGVNVVAVLHQDANFGGAAVNSWETFAASDDNLADNLYHQLQSPPDNAGCGRQQRLRPLGAAEGLRSGPPRAAIFDDSGGCVTVPAGGYSNTVVAGIPNDFADSVIVGNSARVVAYRDTAFSGPSCSFAAGTRSALQCSPAFGANSLSSFRIVASSTSGELVRATPTAGGTSIDGWVHGPAARQFDVSFYAAASCYAAGPHLLGNTTVTTDTAGNAYFSASAGAVSPGAFVHAVIREHGEASDDDYDATTSVTSCVIAGPDNDSWPRALAVAPGYDRPVCSTPPARRAGTSSRSRRTAASRSRCRTCPPTTT